MLRTAIPGALIGVIICIVASGGESVASEWMDATEPAQLVSQTMSRQSAAFASAKKFPENVPLPENVSGVRFPLKTMYALLVTLIASIAVRFKRLADRKHIRDVLNNNTDWHQEMAAELDVNALARRYYRDSSV